jgi:hypothetical protein
MNDCEVRQKSMQPVGVAFAEQQCQEGRSEEDKLILHHAVPQQNWVGFLRERRCRRWLKGLLWPKAAEIQGTKAS